jgi:CheY-like chemotaxis protein
MGLRNLVVYVVDDEKVIAETLATILCQSGFTAIAFHDPRQALTAAESGSSPDVLISDFVMPGISGIELAIQIRQAHPQCRIFLFSGQAATGNLLEEARHRGHEFEILSKPIHPAELLAKLRPGPQAVDEGQTLASARRKSSTAL